ncbi:MAG: HD domain-containing protein [Bdellovibrionota bacterium]|jgi:tRNA nucleotidyltransferase (CCA-adding enzyme)
MEDLEKYLSELTTREPIATLYTALGEDAALHIVGGTIREVACGERDGDIDLATRLTPDEVGERLKSCGVRVIETGLLHGTVTALVGTESVEITTFRKRVARGVLGFSEDIAEDLSARDFTINALAFNIATRRVLDPYDGLSDLRSKILRGVGDAEERFKEDPLRLLRMVRFGAAAGRSVAEETVEAAKRSRALISSVSVERVREEFSKILVSEYARAAFHLLYETGLLEVVLPEIMPAIGFEQNEFHIHDVFEHTLDVIERSPRDLILRLAALFHDIGKTQTLSIDDGGRRHFYCHEAKSVEICNTVMRRLRYSNEDIRRVSLLVAQHMRSFTCGAAGVRRIMRDLGSELDNWLLFKEADISPAMGQEEFLSQKHAFLEILEEEKKRLEEPAYGKLAVSGDDILAMGVKAGPEVGKILNYLKELVLDDPERNEKSKLIKLAQVFFSEGKRNS